MADGPTAQEGTSTDAAEESAPHLPDQLDVSVSENNAPARSWTFAGERFFIGSHPSNELLLRDSTVSRFHCEVRTESDGIIVRDLGSRNGTWVDGVRVIEAYLGVGAAVSVGRARLVFGAPPARRAVTSTATELGGLCGSSAAMRAVYTALERAARTSSTVLLEGETGTGKGEAALALHKSSERGERPFVVVDCGSIPANLFESELFGHEKGAFTGADRQHIGAFESAHGGTIFLDEIGELPLEVQPKLLRVLEERQFRRVGNPRMHPLDVRVVAATNRDLRNAVNQATFRPDLYFRLAVVRVRLPALRERLDDLAPIVTRLAASLGATSEQVAALTAPASLVALRRHPWAGNIRELRNHLESAMVLDDQAAGDPAAPALGELGSYQDGRQRALMSYDRHYLEALIARHGGKVGPAAEAAGLSRVHLYRLLAKYRVRT